MRSLFLLASVFLLFAGALSGRPPIPRAGGLVEAEDNLTDSEMMLAEDYDENEDMMYDEDFDTGCKCCSKIAIIGKSGNKLECWSECWKDGKYFRKQNDYTNCCSKKAKLFTNRKYKCFTDPSK